MAEHDEVNIFLKFLEEEGAGQRASFFSRQDQFAKTPNQKRAFASLFDEALNDYLGKIGTAIKAGEAPTLTFDRSNDDFDFSRRLRQQTPLYSTPQGVTKPRVRLQFNPAFR